MGLVVGKVAAKELLYFDRSAIVRMAFVAILYFSYCVMYIVPLQRFAYTNLYPLDVNWGLVLLNFFVIAFIAKMLSGQTTPKNVFLWSVFALVVIPRLVQASCGNDAVWYCLLCIASFAVVVAVSQRMKEKHLKGNIGVNLRESNRAIVVLSASAFVVFPIAILVTTLGVPSLDAFNFENVYEIRSDREFGFGLSGALVVAGTRVAPAFIAFFLASGLWGGAVVVTIAELLLFLWTANKAWLLLCVLVWGVYFIMKAGWFTVTRILALFSTGMLLTAVVSSVYCEGVVLVVFSFLVRRLIFVPAALGEAYFNFFLDGNSLVWLQNTFLGFLTPMPEQYLDVDYVVQIGSYAMGADVVTNANTGLYGGEFANFGAFFGFVAATLNLLLICELFSFKGDEASDCYMYIIAVITAFLLLNTSTIRLLFSPSGLIGSVITIGLALAVIQERVHKAPFARLLKTSERE